MPCRAVIFDLDGTLLDSLEDIASSMNFVLLGMGFSDHPLNEYRAFVGDGIEALARRALPAGQRDDATLAACVERMRKRYVGHSDLQTRAYDGIPQLLDALDSRGFAKAVLSNKPHEMTVALVSRLLPAWHFSPVFGERKGVARKPDPAAALEILRVLRVEAVEALYVGDTPVDLETARAAGIPSVAATWGFRGEDELKAAGAKQVARHPLEVLNFMDVRT